MSQEPPHPGAASRPRPGPVGPPPAPARRKEGFRSRAVGRSVHGASHVRSGLPNQDALKIVPAGGEGTPLMLAVADGHGDPPAFRSAPGSALAVDAATGVLEEELTALTGPADAPGAAPNASLVKRLAEERLPQMIVERWNMLVRFDLEQHPFTEQERHALGPGRPQAGPANRRRPVSAEGGACRRRRSDSRTAPPPPVRPRHRLVHPLPAGRRRRHPHRLAFGPGHPPLARRQPADGQRNHFAVSGEGLERLPRGLPADHR